MFSFNLFQAFEFSTSFPNFSKPTTSKSTKIFSNPNPTNSVKPTQNPNNFFFSFYSCQTSFSSSKLLKTSLTQINQTKIQPNLKTLFRSHEFPSKQSINQHHNNHFHPTNIHSSQVLSIFIH